MAAKASWIGLGLAVVVTLVGCAGQVGSEADRNEDGLDGGQSARQAALNSDQVVDLAVAAPSSAETRASQESTPVAESALEAAPGSVSDLDASAELSDDCNTNGIPDECDLSCAGECQLQPECGGSTDCDSSGVPDACELEGHDCNTNGVLDDCELEGSDCDTNGVPDECELEDNDCNTNSVLDECDITGGTSDDCDDDGMPDECELEGHDCNTNGVLDDCDIAGGVSADYNSNGIPDECELESDDCNTNGIPDEFDIANGTSADCNTNSIPDECDIAGGASEDCDDDGVPDECELDSDGDGLIDDCDACSHSILSDTIVIDSCDSGITNRVLGDEGCTMADRIGECAEGARNHGAFVSCVAHLTNAWKRDGLITGREKGRIQRCAAQAEIP